MVTVEDGFPFAGVGAEIIALINETRGFDYLRGPVQRVTAIDIPMPYAKNLEDAVVPHADSIVKAVQKVMKFQWLKIKNLMLSSYDFIFSSRFYPKIKKNS